MARALGWSIACAAFACSRNHPAPAAVASVKPPPAEPSAAPPAAASSPVNLPVPTVELVVADTIDDSGKTPVRFAKTTPAGLTVTGTVSVPGSIAALAWVGPEPVAMLDDGEVGAVSAKGYARMLAVPAARWKIPKPRVATEPDAPTGLFDTPRWRLIVDAAGAVWQARCDWGWDLPHGIAHHCVPEGGRCDAWVYARVSPGPLVISRNAPSQIAFDSGSPSAAPVPAVSPSPTVHADIVPVGADHRAVLRCTEAGTTIQYPTDDDRDERQSNGDGVEDLTWLSTTPPILAVSRRAGCLDTEWVVFEGCKESDQYGGAQLSGGPDDVLAISTGSVLTLGWHDHLIGTLDGSARFAFAPAH